MARAPFFVFTTEKFNRECCAPANRLRTSPGVVQRRSRPKRCDCIEARRIDPRGAIDESGLSDLVSPPPRASVNSFRQTSGQPRRVVRFESRQWTTVKHAAADRSYSGAATHLVQREIAGTRRVASTIVNAGRLFQAWWVRYFPRVPPDSPRARKPAVSNKGGRRREKLDSFFDGIARGSVHLAHNRAMQNPRST